MTRQFTLPLPQMTAMTLEDFLPSPSNAQAVQWLISTTPTQWPGHALLLVGPRGSGKTHLASIWAAQNEAQCVRLGAESVLESIARGAAIAPAYTLDDADGCAGCRREQEWLQHFYNATQAAGAIVLFTAQTQPQEWGLDLPDILTRLKSCPVATLKEPDDELMRGLLLKLFRDRQLLVDPGVVDYLAARLERTGTAVQAAVAALDVAALEGHRKISIPLAQKILMNEEIP